MVEWRLMPEALLWGVGEPVRGSGWRVRVGVVVRGGVLERLARCAADGGWKCRWSVGLFRQSDSGCGDEVDVLPSIVWLFVGG